MNNEKNRIKEELIELLKLRDLLEDRIQRLQYRMIAPVHRGSGNGYSVVYAEDLRPYVQAWIDDHKPLRSLAERADVNEHTLYAILRGTRETVKESTADKILQALELPHIFNQLVPLPPEDYHYVEE